MKQNEGKVAHKNITFYSLIHSRSSNKERQKNLKEKERARYWIIDRALFSLFDIFYRIVKTTNAMLPSR